MTTRRTGHLSPEQVTQGKRFQHLRQAAGLTQAGLAKAAGVPVRSYQQWEQGTRTPLLSAAAKVAVALGVDLEVLAGIQPLPPAPKKGGRP